MKIFSIVVFPPAKKAFSASLNGAFFQTDPHEKFIKDNKWRADLIRNQNGIHELKPSQRNQQKDFYYCFIEGNRIAILASDEKITAHGQDVLEKKISAAQSSEALMTLIQHPDEAIKSDLEKQCEISKIKINKIKQDIDLTKSILLEDLDKLVIRNENLSELEAKTQELQRVSQSFKKQATKLKNRYYCPGLFSIFTSIKNLIWKEEAYDYQYRPTQKVK